ncbi:MAG TPA: hypothetical protein VLJ76_05940 [Gaiellaceae bacterium]|nr:hypothetical protein [Gaiellaceae bacterium]
MRLVAVTLAGVALLASLAGAEGLGRIVLLAAIVAAGARLLEAVGLVAERRSDRFPVVMSVVGIAWLVAAGAAHLPWLALGLVVCVALELLGEIELEPDVRSDLA